MPSFRSACACGHHRSQGEHDRAMAADQVVEEALFRALFPDRALRRRFLATHPASVVSHDDLPPGYTTGPLSRARVSFTERSLASCSSARRCR